MANEYKVVTQDHIEQITFTIATFTTDFGIKVMDLRVQNDPDYWRMGQMLMALQGILDMLRDYDIEADIFTEQELMYAEELAMQLIQHCPLQA